MILASESPENKNLTESAGQENTNFQKISTEKREIRSVIGGIAFSFVYISIIHDNTYNQDNTYNPQ